MEKLSNHPLDNKAKKNSTKSKSKWLRKCSPTIAINKSHSRPHKYSIEQQQGRWSIDDDKADNTQIRFGSKIYLISFYWMKVKGDESPDSQTKRKIRRAKGNGKMFTIEQRIRCRIINLFALNQLKELWPLLARLS